MSDAVGDHPYLVNLYFPAGFRGDPARHLTARDSALTRQNAALVLGFSAVRAAGHENRTPRTPHRPISEVCRDGS